MSRLPLLPLALVPILASCSGGAAHRAETSAPTPGSVATAADSQEACSFADTYRFEWSGGMTPYHEAYTLQPPDRFSTVRETNFRPHTVQRCEGTLPACESPDGLTVREISARLTDPVVLEAWPDSGGRILGRDLRPVDAPLMVVTREGGGSLLIGEDCRDASGCAPLPPEVAALAETLGELAREISSTEACAGLGR